MNANIKSVIIRKTLIFRHLPEKDLNFLAEAAVPVEFNRGDIIFLEKEKPKGLYVIIDGQARLFSSDKRGRDITLWIEKDGHTLVELPCFDGGNYHLSAQAITRLNTLLLPMESINQVILNTPELYKDVVLAISIRMRRLINVAQRMAVQGVRERLVRYLCEQMTQHGDNVEIREPKEAIAAQIGSVREVVSRQLAQLHREGFIDLRGHKIVISNPNGVRQLLGEL